MYTENSQHNTDIYQKLRKIKKRKSTPKNKTLPLASEEYYQRTEAFMTEICRRLQDARLQATAELAKATGLTVAAIYKYEKQGRISMPTFIRVLFALQLEIDVIPFFQEQVSVGKEFECIVQDLDADTQAKILQEVCYIVGLIKKE